MFDYHSPTQVYLLYDKAGELLYVGCSRHPEQRIAAHGRKPWGDEIDPSKTVIETHSRWTVGTDRERALIRERGPRYNVVWRAEYEDDGFYNLGLRTPRSLHTRLHQLSVVQRINLQELYRRAILEYLERHEPTSQGAA